MKVLFTAHCAASTRCAALSPWGWRQLPWMRGTYLGWGGGTYLGQVFFFTLEGRYPLSTVSWKVCTPSQISWKVGAPSAGR